MHNDLRKRKQPALTARHSARHSWPRDAPSPAAKRNTRRGIDGAHDPPRRVRSHASGTVDILHVPRTTRSREDTWRKRRHGPDVLSLDRTAAARHGRDRCSGLLRTRGRRRSILARDRLLPHDTVVRRRNYLLILSHRPHVLRAAAVFASDREKADKAIQFSVPATAVTHNQPEASRPRRPLGPPPAVPRPHFHRHAVASPRPLKA